MIFHIMIFNKILVAYNTDTDIENLTCEFIKRAEEEIKFRLFRNNLNKPHDINYF